MREARVVLVTVPDGEVAARLCRALLEERLVACGNVVPGVTSIYRWEGETKEETEQLLILKTGDDVLARLLRRVAELHPYDVPEILALPVVAGHPEYLDWVGRSTEAES
jgi:periplasmic divalent cation tolerance protein